MINFHCKNCGQKFNVPEINAGKKGKCPKCKSIVLIPYIEPIATPAIEENAGNSKVNHKQSPLDPILLDLPQAKAQSPPTEYDIRSETAEDKLERQLQKKIEQSESVGNRKLPWIIDIFLYPVSVPGLVTLGIIIGIPLLIDIAAALLGPFASAIAIPSLIANIVVGLYLYWYIAECIRDSADGGLRAPETLGSAPGLSDMSLRALDIVGCLIVFWGPMGFYFLYTHKIDAIFWSLSAYAVFFFPMGLLSVIVFDSFSGINPILLIGSILRTFFPYCAMVIVFVLVGFLIGKIASAAPQSLVFSFVIHCFNLYLALVAAHLLGRFYWRYKDKLNWEV